MKHASVGKIIIGIFTVILTISLIVFVASGIGQIRDANYEPRYLDEEDYVSTLQREDYVNLLEMTSHDTVLGKKHSNTVISCQAVAHYYEAASLYRAFLAIGNTKNASVQVQRMEQFASQTGEFGEYVEKINELLEIDSAA